MNIRKGKFLWVCLLVLVLMIGLVSLNGCKKSEPAPSEVTAEDAQQVTDQEAKEAEALIAKLSTEALETIEQTTCPIMDGNPINKDLFVEYKGKKVYFWN